MFIIPAPVSVKQVGTHGPRHLQEANIYLQRKDLL